MSIADYLIDTKDDPTMYAIVAYYFAWMTGDKNGYDPKLAAFIAQELELDDCEQFEIFEREARDISNRYKPETDESN